MNEPSLLGYEIICTLLWNKIYDMRF